MYMLKLALAAIFLAAFVADSEAAKLGPNTRANLAWGNPTVGDFLLFRTYAYRQPIASSIQSEDIIFRGNVTTRVTGVYATEVGYTQYASAWILSGGLGSSNVTVRLQSSIGYGYYYLIDIWGRYY